MTIRRKDDLKPFDSEHGETVREFFGKAVGPDGVQHSLAHIVIAPGKASLKHHHPIAEESYYILSGQARMVIDGEECAMKASDGVVILPKREHQIFNDGEEDLVFIAVCVPPWTPDCSVFS